MARVEVIVPDEKLAAVLRKRWEDGWTVRRIVQYDDGLISAVFARVRHRSGPVEGQESIPFPQETSG